MTVPQDRAELERRLWTNLLRFDYLSPEGKKMVRADACTRLGHPPKVAKPLEWKQAFEKGCVCGRVEIS